MKTKKIVFLILVGLAGGFFLGCAGQGPVIIKSASPRASLPAPEKSTSSIPSSRFAPSPYSPDYVLRIFNPHPYPAKVIIGTDEEYLAPAQKMDVVFEKGIDSRDIYVYAIFLDPKSAPYLNVMSSIGTSEERVRIPARGDSESEGSLILDRIREFRYLRKRK